MSSPSPSPSPAHRIMTRTLFAELVRRADTIKYYERRAKRQIEKLQRNSEQQGNEINRLKNDKRHLKTRLKQNNKKLAKQERDIVHLKGEIEQLKQRDAAMRSSSNQVQNICI